MQIYFDWGVFWDAVLSGAYYVVPLIVFIEIVRYSYNRNQKNKPKKFNPDDYI
jgi:hypothetical protein